MSRNVLLVLLLATNIVLAGDDLETEPVASATETHPQSEETQAQTEETQKQTEEAQEQSEQEQIDDKQVRTGKDAKLISGMSVLGNQEAPKSLVIVPWKGSEIGDSVNISTMLDDSRLPVDKEVFMRALIYYEISSGRTP